MTRGPLHDLLVVEIGQYIAAPYASLALADLGARVIKVEPPQGDGIRNWGPFPGGESAPYIAYNRNKECVEADLASPEGRDLVESLLERADIVIENNRPGVMAAFDLSAEVVCARHPRLIYCSITGYGMDSPYGKRPGFDLVIQGVTGVMSLTGDPHAGLAKVAVPIVDGTASLHATTAILAAVHERAETGLGTRIDISLQASTMTWMMLLASGFFATGTPPQRLGSAHPFAAPYQAFQASDGYMTIAAGNQRQWERLCQVLSLPELLDDARFETNELRSQNYEALAARLAPLLSARPREEWIGELSAAGVPCGPVNTLAEALDDAALLERGLVVEFEHSKAGVVRTIGNPIRYGDFEAPVRASPLQGEHTDLVTEEFQRVLATETET